MGKKWGYLEKNAFFLKRKNSVWGCFSESIEILFLYWRGFE